MTATMNKVNDRIVDSSTICLFGMGVLLEDCLNQVLMVLGRKPDYICDNAEGKWGKHFFGIPCISPADLSNVLGDILVIITVKNYEPIYEQLRANGITNILLLTFERGLNVIGRLLPLPEQQVSEPKNDNLPISLSGKWALITGASRGIGYQIALSMAKLGVNIITHSRSHSHNEAIISECSKLGVETISMEAELSSSREVENLLEKLPQVDILFNCAGVSLPNDAVWAVASEDFSATYAINTIAPIMLCNHLIPLMIDRGFGRVINVSSSIQNRPYEMAYACSKAALDKYVHDISPTLSETGVLISLVDPGWLQTDMGGKQAPCSVESVIPGAILGAVLDEYENGHWFSAQDFSGRSIEDAMQKVKFISDTADISKKGNES